MAIRQSQLQKGEQLRQNLLNSSTQNFAAHKKQKDEQIQKKSMEKNIVIPSYNREIENMSSIERLKYEYGIEKNVVLTKDNVQKNRELIEKYTQFFTAYPDKQNCPVLS
jgi:hypothetical protein